MRDDVFSLLPPFTWRGLAYPVTARNVAFQHENATTKIQYRDGAFIEQTGAQPLAFSYTLPMREGIAKGPYSHLFTEGLLKLFASCRARQRDTLFDPLYGFFTCVPTSYNDDTDVNRRDGTDVRVEFMVTLVQDEVAEAQGQFSTGGAVAEGKRLDAELTSSRDWDQEPAPEGMTDILSAINTFGQRGLRQVDKLSAYLNDIAFRLEKIEDTADRAENPQNWGLRNDVRRMREAVLQLNKRATEPPGRKFRRIAQKTAATVSSVAADFDMTVGELLRLNPGLARLPMVPVGTVITAKVAKSV